MRFIMIYVLFGHSAAGKTTVLNMLKSSYQIDVNIKATNRLSRDENDDVVSYRSVTDFINDKMYSPYIYSHGYADKDGSIIYYGINKWQIDMSLRYNRPHWLICSSIEMYNALLDEYFPYTVLIYLSARFPKKRIINYMKQRKFSETEDMRIRINSLAERKRDFASNRMLFDHIIVNNYKKTVNETQREIRRLVYLCIDIMKQYGD